MSLINRKIKNKIIDLSVAGEPEFFENSFNPFYKWGDLEYHMNLQPLMTSKRVHLQTEEYYSWGVSSWMTDANTFPASILFKETKKYHCHFSDASKFNEKINQICQELEVIYGNFSTADAHIYFNLSEDLKGGFGIHYDEPDNLIIQMEGRTKFEVWSKSVFPIDHTLKKCGIDNLPVDPTLVVELNPGDAIFIPKRTYHRATNLTKRLSISFPILKFEKNSIQANNYCSPHRKWENLDI